MKGKVVRIRVRCIEGCNLCEEGEKYQKDLEKTFRQKGG